MNPKVDKLFGCLLSPQGVAEREISSSGILTSDFRMSGDTPLSPSPNSTSGLGKLKEPRDLYSTTTLLHPIKWPIECEVIPEKVVHIDTSPRKFEVFYHPTGREPQPQPVGVEMGTVAYDYQPRLSVDYFCRASTGGSTDLGRLDAGNPDTNSLKFESRFESGNLAKAIKITSTYYELYLRPDLYTDRHVQWFYFRIQNMKVNLQYRFSIVNFNKPDSLYRCGLKVLMYSEKDAQLNNTGWSRCGQNIAYFKNDISQDENGPYYTLTFNLVFRHNNDTVYLAQCYPYTYSTLQNYLKNIEDDEFRSQLLTIRLLCRSLAGNNVHVLTVTSPATQSASTERLTIADEGNQLKKKPVIVISSRVHPGETQSSYMMKGIIDFLTSDCSQAKELRDRFIFKLVPMINPDGVIVGNSRCCLLGQDLNRQYRTVLREAFPQIYHLKVMLRRLHEENGIFLYCDIHGHSRKHNVFIYGCENRKMPEKRLAEQVFPLMMHKNAADKFSFQNCKFKIQKNKEGTGRIFVWTLGVVNSYTLEISLGGSTMPSRQYSHFTTADYEACGRHFCETLLDFSNPDPMKEILREKILQKLVDCGSTADEPRNVILSDYSSLSHSETDDDVEDDGNESNCFERNSRMSTSTSTTSSTSAVGSSIVTNPGKQKRHTSNQKHNFASDNIKVKPEKFVEKNKVKIETRSPLLLSKTALELIKSRPTKLGDGSILEAPTLATNSTCEPSMENTTMSSSTNNPNMVSATNSIEMPGTMRRFTKFRRKARRSTSFRRLDMGFDNQQFAKCTRILFDDPFNPPGTKFRDSNLRCRHRLDEVLQASWQSGTEDECDPYDMSRSPSPSGTRLRNNPGYSSARTLPKDEGVMQLIDPMTKLAVSSDSNIQKSCSDSEIVSMYPAFVPFSPTFPVGREFLHQTFIPQMTNHSKKVLSSKKRMNEVTAKNYLLKTSSVTTTSARRSSTGMTGSAESVITDNTLTRRSSVNHMPLKASGKLQATNLRIPSTSTSSTVASNRRRVSWTGTLTVSVPTVAINEITTTIASTSSLLKSNIPQESSHRQKFMSFRKSKSLNDKLQNNSSEINNGQSTAVATTSASMDKLARPTSGSKMKLASEQFDGYGRSMETPPKNPTVLPTSTATPANSKKRRTKLKRSNHNK